MHVQRNTFCSGSFLTRAVVAKQSHNKLHNWHADSSRRSIVQLSGERTAPRIWNWTSLKCCIHFSFIQSLQFLFANNSKGLWLLAQCNALHPFFAQSFSHDISHLTEDVLQNSKNVCATLTTQSHSWIGFCRCGLHQKCRWCKHHCS